MGEGEECWPTWQSQQLGLNPVSMDGWMDGGMDGWMVIRMN